MEAVASVFAGGTFDAAGFVGVMAFFSFNGVKFLKFNIHFCAAPWIEDAKRVLDTGGALRVRGTCERHEEQIQDQ